MSGLKEKFSNEVFKEDDFDYEYLEDYVSIRGSILEVQKDKVYPCGVCSK